MIVQGAEVAFGEHGYHEVRVEDILQHAGVSRPTFYKHFRNKDEVFAEIVQSRFAELRDGIVDVWRSREPERWIEDSVTYYLRWRASIGAFGRVLERLTTEPGNVVSDIASPLIDAIYQAWEAGISRAGGQLPDRLLFDAIVGAAMTLGASFSSEAPDEEAIARRRDVLVRLVEGAFADGD